MHKKKIIYILIVTHNNQNSLKKLINDLSSCNYSNYLKVILINDCKKKIKIKNKTIKKIINLDGDQYWFKSMNIGLKYLFHNKKISKNDYLVWLNDDCRIYDKNYFIKIINISKKISNIFYVPYVFFDGEKKAEFKLIKKFNFLLFNINHNISLSPRGVCSSIKNYQKVGYFDETFNLAFSDILYFFKARCMGFKLHGLKKNILFGGSKTALRDQKNLKNILFNLNSKSNIYRKLSFYLSLYWIFFSVK